MTTAIRIAMAAAVIVIAAAVGINLLRPDVGGPTPTSDPSSLAVELPSTATDLEAGTYRLASSIWTPRSFILTVPSGWRTGEGFVTKGGRGPMGDLYVVPWVVTHVFGDACTRPVAEADGLVETGTAQQVADALASQGGHVTTRTDTTLDGRLVQRLTFEVAGDFDVSACTGGVMRLWPDAGPDLNGGLTMRTGQTVTVHVIDLDGDVLVLASASIEGASTAELSELDQVIASIRFAPAGESTARHWIAAVNDGDASLMSSLMADQIMTGDQGDIPVARADMIDSVLATWCPMTIDSVEPAADGYLMGLTFGDNEAGTCTAGAPGTSGTMFLGVEDGKVTRIP
jgi:hypothetical protein